MSDDSFCSMFLFYKLPHGKRRKRTDSRGSQFFFNKSLLRFSTRADIIPITKKVSICIQIVSRFPSLFSLFLSLFFSHFPQLVSPLNYSLLQRVTMSIETEMEGPNLGEDQLLA